MGAPCGVMDQMTSACGEANKLLAMVCQVHIIILGLLTMTQLSSSVRITKVFLLFFSQLRFSDLLKYQAIFVFGALIQEYVTGIVLTLPFLFNRGCRSLFALVIRTWTISGLHNHCFLPFSERASIWILSFHNSFSQERNKIVKLLILQCSYIESNQSHWCQFITILSHLCFKLLMLNY